MNKGDFIGSRRFGEAKRNRCAQALIGFEVTERGIARDEQEVSDK